MCRQFPRFQVPLSECYGGSPLRLLGSRKYQVRVQVQMSGGRGTHAVAYGLYGVRCTGSRLSMRMGHPSDKMELLQPKQAKVHPDLD